jgi:muramoyltetrapeptide carboxypeptidase LdcA involved in peptidoglycan recycling
MKIALVNLCKIEDFAVHKSYTDSISFLKENNINYLDFASGAPTLQGMVEKFNEALDSDAELLWFIRGGNKCIQTLDLLDWDKVKESGKKFYGLSDFTHFAVKAKSIGLTCYYGQGLTSIKDYFPTEQDRKFIVDFLQTGVPVAAEVTSLNQGLGTSSLNLSEVNVVGGHLFIFTLMQSQLQINLKDSYVFIEYHTGLMGEKLDDLGYYIDQLLYVLKDNLPLGFILGRTEMVNPDGTRVNIDEINKYCADKLARINIPVYYIDHFTNTFTFR